MQASSPRDLIRAAYLYGVQEGAQATVERVCDDRFDELPHRLHAELWEQRHELAVEMRETTRELCEEMGYPAAIEPASDPVEK